MTDPDTLPSVPVAKFFKLVKRLIDPTQPSEEDDTTKQMILNAFNRLELDDKVVVFQEAASADLKVSTIEEETRKNEELMKRENQMELLRLRSWATKAVVIVAFMGFVIFILLLSFMGNKGNFKSFFEFLGHALNIVKVIFSF